MIQWNKRETEEMSDEGIWHLFFMWLPSDAHESMRYVRCTLAILPTFAFRAIALHAHVG